MIAMSFTLVLVVLCASGFWEESGTRLFEVYGLGSMNMDSISFRFILLTVWVMVLCMLVYKGWGSRHGFLKVEKGIVLVGLLVLLTLLFMTQDILYFYILFEIIVVPVYFLINIWGSREERRVASSYFFILTLVGSLVMLISLIQLQLILGGTLIPYVAFYVRFLLESEEIGLYAVYREKPEFMDLGWFEDEMSLEFYLKLVSMGKGNSSLFVYNWILFGLLLGFAIKLPVYPFHIYLPQAHVEAPLIGSILLAGILLKIGGYGFIRFISPMLLWNLFYFLPICLCMGIFNVVYGGLNTLRQVDGKKLVAYSSVAHMGIVFVALLLKGDESVNASIYLMVAHGFVSSALFTVVTILYLRFNTRILHYWRGILMTSPIFVVLFFVLTLANIAFPTTVNFMGEFISFISIGQQSSLIFPILALSLVLSGAYSIYFFNRVAYGQISSYMSYARDVAWSELASLLYVKYFVVILGYSFLNL
uniref:NADH-ubiquinone oxidoreductase chain 4 n=1 Tax=Clathrina clathrus TaxID=1031547 RepID=L0HRD1_CLACL|nr:NADH dehydrogenase subunit 4 [Clathrina clathrus]AGB07378.1 NADH dehydrogenase subunit 4 [Clathrina clathrus]